jgi:ABC-type sugar transport system ATPase subunit
LRASVSLVEPLGSKDVVHLAFEDHSVRAIATPGVRPRIGEVVGLAFDQRYVLYFDHVTGLAVG